MATGDIYQIKGGLQGRSAVAFKGGDTNDYVQIDAHAVARVAANDAVGTYVAWINLKDITGTYCVLGGADLSADEFLDITIEAGLLTVRITDATTVQLVTQADAVHFKPHSWYHIAVVQSNDSKGPKLFVDGALVASTNDTTTDVNSWYAELDLIDQFQIGASQKGGAGAFTLEFAGGISDVKYWSIDLTDAEVNQDFLNEAVQAASLQLHLDMVEDLVDAGLGLDDGTIVSDVLLINNYCEFYSRLVFAPTIPLVADSVLPFASGDTGHAIIIEA